MNDTVDSVVPVTAEDRDALRNALARNIAATARLAREKDRLLQERAALDGFNPCDDCVSGWCTMNCSSAPVYLQVLM